MDIGVAFEPLYALDELQKSTVRKTDADRDAALVSIGALSPDEVRQRVANDPESGYDNLDVDDGMGPDLEGRANTLEVKDRINDK